MSKFIEYLEGTKSNSTAENLIEKLQENILKIKSDKQFLDELKKLVSKLDGIKLDKKIEKNELNAVISELLSFTNDSNDIYGLYDILDDLKYERYETIKDIENLIETYFPYSYKTIVSFIKEKFSKQLKVKTISDSRILDDEEMNFYSALIYGVEKTIEKIKNQKGLKGIEDFIKEFQNS